MKPIGLNVQEEIARAPSYEERDASPESLEVSGKYLEAISKWAEDHGKKGIWLSTDFARYIAGQLRAVAQNLGKGEQD